MNKLTYILLLGLVIFTNSCKITLPVKVTEIPLGPSVGKASCDCYLGFICPDAVLSVNQAVENGRLYKISSVDIEKEVKLLGIITTYTTIVSGYSKNEWVDAFEKPSNLNPIAEVAKKEEVKSPVVTQVEEKPVLKTQPKPTEPITEKVVAAPAPTNAPVKKQQMPLESVVSSNENVDKVSRTPEKTVVETATNSVKPARTKIENTIDPLSSLPKIEIRGTSLADLSSKIRDESEIKMVSGDYLPIDIVLDLKRFTFSCLLLKKNTNYIKMGLYFGPKSTGCESCDNILVKNPGSQILHDEVTSNFIVQIIAIKKN